jgi:hypothetical protein
MKDSGSQSDTARENQASDNKSSGTADDSDDDGKKTCSRKDDSPQMGLADENAAEPGRNELTGTRSGKRPKLPRPVGISPCPRCNSEDTKFCYYNNYNIKQPRYFCKV